MKKINIESLIFKRQLLQNELNTSLKLQKILQKAISNLDKQIETKKVID